MKRALVITALLAAVAAAPAQAGISKADRASVNALLDRFIPDVVAGKDLRAGKALVGGYVSVDTIQRYPAAPGRYHGWLLDYATPGDVGFDVVVQPVNKRKIGAWSFRGEAQKIGGRWKITTWYPVATFAPPGRTQTVLGPNDLGAANSASAAGTDRARLGSWVLLLPGLGLAALALGAIAFALQRWLRQRSRVRELQRSLAR
jgi:hypothetical protein